MDTHFQLPSITPSGHENSQGVHVCHKCGWPFPKLHPSSKHRRAHKRICGTIEGYKLTHLSGSDDEQDHPSDDDCKTPSPKIEKRSIGGVGERSYRSEDEVFSDAVAEFSDSGISPGSEEQMEDVKELEKNVRKNVVDDDIYSTGTLKVDADCDSAKPMGSQPVANIVPSSGLVESTHSGKDKAEMSNHSLSLFSAPVENTKAIVDAVQIKGYLAQDMMDGSSSQLSEIHGTNTEEKEATHVQSVSNDLPIVEDADIMLKDAEKQKVLKSEFPLVLGSVDVKRTLNKDNEDMPEGQSIEPAKTLTGFECERTAHDLSHLSGCAKHDSSAGTVLVGVDPTQDEESGAHCDSVEICNTNRENEETTHVLSVASDLIVVDHADLMLQDFKDHRTFKSRIPPVGSGNVNRSLEGDSEVMVIEESPLKLHSVKLGGASNTSADMDDVEEDMITIEGHDKDFAVTIGKTFDNEELEVPPSTSRSKRENTQLNCSLQRVEPYNEASHTESTGTILSDGDNSKHNVMARAEEVDTEGNEVSERVTRNEHSAEANTILVYEDGNQAPKLRHNNGVEHVDIMMNFPDEAWIDDSTEAAAVEKFCTPTMTNLEPEHELSYTNHTESTDTILCDCNNNNHNVMVRAEEVDTEGIENSERVKHSAEANTILVYEDGNQAPKLRHNNGVEHVDIAMNFPDEASVGDSTEAVAVEKFSTPTMTNLQPEHELSNTNHTESTDTVFSDCKNNNHNVMARAEEVDTEGSENSESVARNEHSAEANTILVNEDGNQAAKLTHNTEGEHVDVTMNFSDEAWIEEDSTEAAAVEKFSTTTMTNIEPEHKILSSNYSASVQETPISSINTNVSATIMPAHPSSIFFPDNDSQEVSTEPELNSGDEIVVKCVDGGFVDSKFVQRGDVEVEDYISKRPTWKDEETLPIHSEISHESLPDIKTENEMDGKFEIMQKNDVKFDRQAGDASAIILSVDLSNQMESVEGNWGSVSVLSAQSDQPIAGTGVQPKIDPEGPDKSESTKLHKEIASERLDLHNADVFDPPSFMTLVEPRGSDQGYATSKGPGNSESTKLHQGIVSERLDLHKADVFEPPSFMSLVEPRGGSDQENATSEIETVQATQHSKTEVIQAGWVPSLSNVVNESPGRKKNEEMIAKVTNWSTAKQHSTPLKNLLGEAKEETRTKSPSPKQTQTNIQTNATEAKGNVSFATTVKEVLGSEAPAGDRTVRGVTAEEWNSPARFPVEIKKQKKKANGKPFWVPFACCSSVN